MDQPSSYSILAVEDNPETQLLLKHLLQASYDVVITGGVDDALRAVRQHTFDLLLVDINLSEARTGIELLHLLREDASNRSVPAIALTAYAMPGDRDHFIAEGFDSYISKPFTREELMSVIKDTLRAA